MARRTITDFVDWVQGQFIGGLDRMVQLATHSARGDNRLVVEILPIYFYVRNAYAERRNAQIELNDPGVPDATIFDSVGNEIEGIEATAAFERDDHITRRQLVRGFTVEEAWRDASRSPSDYVNAIQTCLESKASKRYGPNTTLVVLLNADWIQERADLIAFVDAVPGKCPPHAFSKVVFVDPAGHYLELL